MSDALSRAYLNNPDINQQRAAVRATDETVPQAKSGWMPKAQAQGSLNYQVTNITGCSANRASKSSPAVPITSQAQVNADPVRRHAHRQFGQSGGITRS